MPVHVHGVGHDLGDASHARENLPRARHLRGARRFPAQVHQRPRRRRHELGSIPAHLHVFGDDRDGIPRLEQRHRGPVRVRAEPLEEFVRSGEHGLVRRRSIDRRTATTRGRAGSEMASRHDATTPAHRERRAPREPREVSAVYEASPPRARRARPGEDSGLPSRARETRASTREADVIGPRPGKLRARKSLATALGSSSRRARRERTNRVRVVRVGVGVPRRRVDRVDDARGRGDAPPDTSPSPTPSPRTPPGVANRANAPESSSPLRVRASSGEKTNRREREQKRRHRASPPRRSRARETRRPRTPLDASPRAPPDESPPPPALVFAPQPSFSSPRWPFFGGEFVASLAASRSSRKSAARRRPAAPRHAACTMVAARRPRSRASPPPSLRGASRETHRLPVRDDDAGGPRRRREGLGTRDARPPRRRAWHHHHAHHVGVRFPGDQPDVAAPGCRRAPAEPQPRVASSASRASATTRRPAKPRHARCTSVAARTFLAARRATRPRRTSGTSWRPRI